MVVLKDIQDSYKLNRDSMNLYKSYNKDSQKIDNSTQPIKPMKWTTNLILNQNISHLKNSSIMNSDKNKPSLIKPYEKFRGCEVLPTFKKDLKSWHIC